MNVLSLSKENTVHIISFTKAYRKCMHALSEATKSVFKLKFSIIVLPYVTTCSYDDTIRVTRFVLLFCN